MGSPISGLYADMVMTDLEVECLKKLKNDHNCIPLVFMRYIDDIFLSVHNS